jgi:N-acetylmuramoyl-L-alanine amidase
MKPWWAALSLLWACVCFAPSPATAETPQVRVFVNDAAVSLPQPAQTVGGVVMAPVAAVVQAFGATIQWDPAARALAVQGVAGTSLRMVVGQTTVTQGEGRWDLPMAPALQNGVLVAPIAPLLRGLGAYVKLHDDGTLDAVSQVTGVDWHAGDDGLTIKISATGPVHATGSLLHGPERLVIDLDSAVIRLAAPTAQIASGAVVGMRAAQFHVQPYVTRLVFDLARPVPFRVAGGGGAVTVAIGAGAGPTVAHGSAGSGAGAAASASSATVSDRPGPSPPAAAAGASSPSSSAKAWGPAAPSSAGPPARGPAEAPGSPSSAGPGGASMPATPEAQGSPATAARAAPPASAASRSTTAASPSAATPGSGSASGGDGSAGGTGGSFDASGGAVASKDAGVPEPVALPPLPEFADSAGAFHVESVTYDDADGRLVIHASQRITVDVHQWTYPDRVALDIHNGVFRDRRADIEIGSGGIRNVVVSQFGLHPNLTRVLVHLNHKIAYTVATADGGRTMTVAFANAGRPGPLAPAVIIDPGHGGEDPGAIGPRGTHEADVALGIGRLVKAALERQGMHAVLTRNDDSTVALEDRPDLAERYGGVVFVSIHANASTDPGVQGTTTYYYTPQSRALAEMVQAEVVRALGEPDRGILAARFYVLVNTQMPAILVETAFISNAAEEAMLRDPAVQTRIAEAIARGIAAFLSEQAQPTAH